MQDIYSRTFYGYYYHNKIEFSGVELFAKKEDINHTPFEELQMEVRLLKNFEGRENVIEIKFPNEEIEHETLFEPSMYYEDETWHKTSYRNTALAFIKMCEKEKILLEKITGQEELSCQTTFR